MPGAISAMARNGCKEDDKSQYVGINFIMIYKYGKAASAIQNCVLCLQEQYTLQDIQLFNIILPVPKDRSHNFSSEKSGK